MNIFKYGFSLKVELGINLLGHVLRLYFCSFYCSIQWQFISREVLALHQELLLNYVFKFCVKIQVYITFCQVLGFYCYSQGK